MSAPRRRGFPRALVAAAALGISAAALGSCVRHVAAAAYGAELANDPRLSPSPNNHYACTTCHAERPGGSADTIYPGAPLAGATERPTFWGGTVLDLETAVSQCYDRFMRGGPLDPTDERAVALYAYLDSLTRTGPATTTAVPFTVPLAITPLVGGDATAGADLYRRACARCHGALRTGAGRISDAAVTVPTATEQEHTRAGGYDEMTFPLVFKEKIRHGAFLGFAGTMPPFSEEALTDAQVADIIAYINPTLQ